TALGFVPQVRRLNIGTPLVARNPFQAPVQMAALGRIAGAGPAGWIRSNAFTLVLLQCKPPTPLLRTQSKLQAALMAAEPVILAIAVLLAIAAPDEGGFAAEPGWDCLGHDVDHAAHGGTSVLGGTGAFHHFNSLNID